MENKKLNDLLISNKLQFEEQLRDTRNKARDEEIKKAQYLTKSYESKLKMFEDGKEGLNRKIQELIRIVQDKESKIADLERDFEDENAKLRQDRSDSLEQINELNYLLSKVKSELADKDNMIGRSVTGSDSEVKALKQQLDAKSKENVQLQISLKEMRARITEIEADSDRKRRELADRCYGLENESRRYREEYSRLADMLKSKINSTIDHVSAPPRR
jgi:regulator of replication initiation timing